MPAPARSRRLCRRRMSSEAKSTRLAAPAAGGDSASASQRASSRIARAWRSERTAARRRGARDAAPARDAPRDHARERRVAVGAQERRHRLEGEDVPVARRAPGRGSCRRARRRQASARSGADHVAEHAQRRAHAPQPDARLVDELRIGRAEQRPPRWPAAAPAPRATTLRAAAPGRHRRVERHGPRLRGRRDVAGVEPVAALGLGDRAGPQRHLVQQARGERRRRRRRSPSRHSISTSEIVSRAPRLATPPASRATSRRTPGAGSSIQVVRTRSTRKTSTRRSCSVSACGSAASGVAAKRARSRKGCGSRVLPLVARVQPARPARAGLEGLRASAARCAAGATPCLGPRARNRDVSKYRAFEAPAQGPDARQRRARGVAAHARRARCRT